MKQSSYISEWLHFTGDDAKETLYVVDKPNHSLLWTVSAPLFAIINHN